MGGKALLALLPHATFPRLSPTLYNAIKSHLHTRLSPLFDRVATPHEAPEKLDHGDIDFIVASPQLGLKHHDVERALGTTSQHSIPSPEVGAGTSHFALSLVVLERELGFVEDGAGHSIPRGHSSLLVTKADVDGRYVQVDVHLCPDVEDFERVVFIHGYGDLGMIMGALARSVGLQLGSKGLKVRTVTRVSILKDILIEFSLVLSVDFFARPCTHILHVVPALIDLSPNSCFLRTLPYSMGRRLRNPDLRV